jgi:hypothetical protein
VEEGEGLKEREWRLNQELTIELPGFSVDSPMRFYDTLAQKKPFVMETNLQPFDF